MSSIHDDLGRNQPPFVHIRYDVNVGNAIEQRELPFVVVVMADLSAHSRNKLPKLKNRPLVDINRQTFNTVLAKTGTTVKFEVENRLQEGGDDLRINLAFKSLDDFEPQRVAEKVAENVKQFGRLLELRRRIKMLLTSMDGNDDVEAMLKTLITDESARKQLCHDAGAPSVAPEGEKS